MIDVNPNQLKTVTRILAGHVPDCEVRAFGSRVIWTAKDYSDLDLVVVAERALDLVALSRLKEAFEESDLPFRVDVLDWHAIGRAFQKVIEKKYEVVQKSKKKSSGKAGGWIVCTLADACSSIDYGLTASAADSEVGPRFLRITDIVSGHIDWNTVPHVPADNETTAKYRLREGDIVLARTGASTGASAYVKDPPLAVFASYLVRLQAKPTFYSRFLAYYLRSNDFWTFIRGVLGDKSAQPNASASTMAKAPLRAPSDRDEQRAIAHILGTLDDKIELNRRMNETVEAMARALFKSWFVDFDPVRAKVEGRRPGLPKPLVDLFPDSFEDSELGEIPKGWTVEPLSEITTLITKGTTPSQSDTITDDETDAGINFVRVNAIGEYCAVLFDKLTKIPESVHLGVLKRSILRADDVLYTIAGTIGRSAIVDESLLPANTNQAVAIIRPKQAIPAAFLVMTMGATAFREELHSNIVHAVQANLSLGVLSRARTVVPSKETLTQMFMPIAEITKRTSATRAESRTLAALRDTLLPKLISGELRVKDTEQIVEIV